MLPVLVTLQAGAMCRAGHDLTQCLAQRRIEIQCRILALVAFTEKSIVDAAVAGKANWLAQSCDIYRAWIEQYPGGRRELPRPVKGIDRESIRKTLLKDVLPDESLRPVLSFLQSALNQAGVVFSSPGGSFQRWVWNYLVWVMEDESYRFPEGSRRPAS